MKRPRIVIEDSSHHYLSDSLSSFWTFLLHYQTEILVLSCLLVFLVWFTRKNRKFSNEIRKLWIFTLFFLTKRQMMIPLVVTLTQKDGILDGEVRDRLLKIRSRCRDISLKKDPVIRLEMEQQVSKILYYYFTSLENEGKIKPGSKFEKIVKDLEFIDEKLVQLQFVYNREVEKWNRRVTHPLIGWFYALFRFRPFEKFQIPD